MEKLPKVYKHNLALTVEGIGSSNSKERCNCKDCKELKERRDRVFNKWYHKLARWNDRNF